MSKRARTLLISAIVVVVLGASLACVIIFIPNDIYLPPDLTVKLVDKVLSDVQTVSVKNQETEFTIERGPGSQFFSKELEGYNEYQTAYSTLLGELVPLTASKLVEENPRDPTSYGFDPAEAEVKITCKDGTEFVIEVGAESPGGNRYARMPAEGKAVYLLPSPMEQVLAPLTAYIDPVIFSAEGDVSTTSLVSMSLGGTVRPDAITFEENAGALSTSPLAYADYVIIMPFLSATSPAVSSVVPSQIVDIIAESVVTIDPTDAELAEYGLDDPYSTADITVELSPETEQTPATAGSQSETGTIESSCTILLGGKDENGNYYAMLNKDTLGTAEDGTYYIKPGENQVIYTVLPEDVGWAEWQVGDMISTTPALVSITTLSSIEVEGRGISALVKPATTTDSSNALSISGGTINGNELSANDLTSWYQAFQTVTVDDVSDKTPTGSPVFKVTLRYTDNTTPVICEYFTDTERTLLLRISGLEDAPVYTVQTKRLDAFVETTNGILNP